MLRERAGAVKERFLEGKARLRASFSETTLLANTKSEPGAIATGQGLNLSVIS
jgi:hypothetical protein